MLIDFLFVGAPALRELASLGVERGRQQRQMKALNGTARTTKPLRLKHKHHLYDLGRRKPLS